MAVDRAADLCVFVEVRVVQRDGVLLVQHQPRGHQLDVRERADPCDVVVGASEWLPARCHGLEM
jgi:hypothetical protein